MEASPPTASEGGTDAPLAVPERPPIQDQLASDRTSSVPLNKEPTSDNEGDSIAPDRLFGASEKSPRRSEPPHAPYLREQRGRAEHVSAPVCQAGSESGLEQGNLPRLRNLRVLRRGD